MLEQRNHENYKNMRAIYSKSNLCLFIYLNNAKIIITCIRVHFVVEFIGLKHADNDKILFDFKKDF